MEATTRLRNPTFKTIFLLSEFLFNRKNYFLFIKFILIYLFTSASSELFSQSKKNVSGLTISNVYYLDPNTYQWAGPVNINISNGLISSIEKASSNSKPAYLLPSFCDAKVTIGSDSLGGVNNLTQARLAMKSFLAHGFTHVLSSTDSPWVTGLKQEIDSGKTIGPIVSLSARPILKNTSEYELPTEIYFTASKYEDLEKEASKQVLAYSTPVELIHRHYAKNKNYWESWELNRLQKIISSKKGKLIVSTFADRVSILDSLFAGVKYLAHPIPMELASQIQPQHKKELYWMPVFGLYRNLVLESHPDKLEAELNSLKEKSSFFSKYFYEVAKGNIVMEPSENSADEEYRSYMQFFKTHPDLHSRIVLGSGSGHRFAFPGISGLQELGILQTQISSPMLFKSATENSCGFIGLEKTGKIQIGWEANLLLYVDDPSKKYSTLFQIKKLFLKGKEISILTKN